MKIRNKILTSALCLGMVAGMVSPVLAIDNSSDDHLTNISYTVDETYKWAAPADITFDKNLNSNSKTGTVSVEENVIAGDKKLSIKISGEQEFKISNGLLGPNEVKRDYTVTGAGSSNGGLETVGTGSINVGDVVLEVPSGTNAATNVLTFDLKSVTVQQAGTYTGTLNFEAAIVNQQ